MNEPVAAPGSVPFDPQRSPWSDRSGLRAQYRGQLETLDRELVAMGREVLALAAGVAGPAGRPEPLAPGALSVAEGLLVEVQERAGALEDAAFTLVALESPVGGDLREIVAMIRALYDIVRSGRLAIHVLDGITVLEGCGMLTTDGELGRMRTAAVDVFGGAVDAWDARDALAHNDLRSRDDEVDRLRDALVDRHPTCADPRCVTAHVLAVRFLERFADHGVDISAHLSWAVTGDRVLADFGGGS